MVAAPVFSNTRKKGVAGRRDLTVNLHEGEKFMMWNVDVSLLFYVALGTGFCGEIFGGSCPEGSLGERLPLGDGFRQYLWMHPGGLLCRVLVYQAASSQVGHAAVLGIHRWLYGVFFFYQGRTAFLSPWGTYYGVFLSAAPEYTGPIGSQPCFLGGKNIFLKGMMLV